MGDIHGAHKALVQCLERSGFDSSQDRLIVLGDVCDGWPQVKECIDELLKILQCEFILGNHDAWSRDWMTQGLIKKDWLEQGGRATMASYDQWPIPPEHVQFLKRARLYIQEGGRLFVHGGLDPTFPIEQQTQDILIWDRNLIRAAYQQNRFNPNHHYGDFKEIYLGHTPTKNFGSSTPLKMCNVWAMDTGCGWGGRLAIMDIETKNYWQSDLTSELYKGVRGREN